GAAIDDVAQEAVARVVVVAHVAAEPEAIEQAIADRACAPDAAGGARDLGLGVARDRVELIAVGSEVALRVVPRADQEGGMIEREVVAGDDLGEPAELGTAIHCGEVTIRTGAP